MGAVLAGGLLVAGASCGGDDVAAQRTVIQVWAHDGTDAERAVLEGQVAAFNDSQGDVEARLHLVAEGDYNDDLQIALAQGDVPAVIEVDGPLLVGYVAQGVLAPLDDLLAPAALEDQLPSLQAQGRVDGRPYAVGAFDSGLALYADRAALTEAGITWPTRFDEAWTADEFSQVLARLAGRDPDGKVLDVKLNYGVGEWLTYGFAPLVASAGGSLVDADSGEAAGHLDGPAAVAALGELRRWSSYVDANTDDDAFVNRDVALSWVGHWTYRDYAAALGDDLLVLPLPDLGQGPKSGQGSWAWTVGVASGGADGVQEQAAARFLEFLLRDDEVLRMVEANGAVPGTASALASSPLHGEDGPLHLFAEQLLRSCGSDQPTPACVAVPRPSVADYALVSSQFALAVSAALAGDDPEPLLQEAARAVDATS